MLLPQDGLAARRSYHSQIEHAALPQIRHRLAILNAAKTTQGERDAPSRFEYLVRGLPDVDPLRLLQDHLGIQHQRSETVTDLVKCGECGIREPCEPGVMGVGGIGRVLWRNALDLRDEVYGSSRHSPCCGNGETHPDHLAVF